MYLTGWSGNYGMRQIKTLKGLSKAALPLALTRARRSISAKTNEAINHSVRALRDITNM